MNKVKGYKINILHLVLGLGMGGAEVMIIQYIKALGSRKYNHHIYCFGNSGPVKEKLEKLGISVYFGKKRKSIKNPIKFAVSILLLIEDLLKFIKKNQIQIIQSHLRQANTLAVAVGKLSVVPVFPTIHNTMEFIDRRNNLDPRVIINKVAYNIALRSADRIIAVSNEIKTILKNKLNICDSNIIVVKNGITLKNVDTNEYQKNDLFEDSTALKILSVGRLTYQKAMEVLVKATDHLIKNGINDFKIIIVGEGEQRIILEKMIEDLSIQKYIKLVGIRSDVMGLMREADLFVMPSRYEGLSIAMIEAMACGLPIIASDAPGINHYIKSWINGILFPIGDHKALSKNIIILGNNKNLRKKLSEEGKKYFTSEFNMINNINSLVKLIDEYVSI